MLIYRKPIINMHVRKAEVVKVVKLRQKSRSIKAKNKQEEDDAVAEYSKESDEDSAPSTLGDLLKQQMDKD